MILNPLTTLSATSFIAWLYLAFMHGKFWQPLVDADEAAPPNAWPSVTIIVPARNEAATLPHSLPSLLAQDYAGEWKIILVDDHSDDQTSAIAEQLAQQSGAANRLQIITAPDLLAGWVGKVAAMQAGASHSNSDYVLFTDADIQHPINSLRHLISHSQALGLDLNSRMVMLHCQSVIEKWLIPAFVFFFAMLYPFRLSNNPYSPVAAAAGGVVLIKRQRLEQMGGLAAIKSALIDDCSLARAVKKSGGRIYLSLSQTIRSIRPYDGFADIWRMIARTAFTQLNYSAPLLQGCLLGLGFIFLVPIIGFLAGSAAATLFGLVGWWLMSLLYWPMIRFYRLPFYWAFTLPAAAMFYAAATLDSARRYWQGKGGLWKGRTNQ